MFNVSLFVLEVLWFFLPAFAGNIAPVLAAHYHWLPRLNLPLDGGAYLGSNRLLGQNKTIRGVVVGLLAGALVGGFQFIIVALIPAEVVVINAYHNLIGAVSLGMLISCGALLGDAIKSFYKRRLHIPAGISWKPWDQIDIVIGVLLVTFPFFPFSLSQFFLSLIVIGLGMFIISYFGFRLGIKESI